MGHGIALDDNGIIFPTGVPVSSISIRACLDSKVLATMEDEKEALADDIAYMLEFLDFDSPVASFANAVFEDGRLIIEAVPVMYSHYRAALAKWRENGQAHMAWLPWSVPNAMGLVMSVLTSDGYIVWAFRDINRFVRGAQVDASVVETIEVPEDGWSDGFLEREIIRCFEDDLCPYPASEPVEARIDGVFFDEGYGQWAIMARMYCPLSKDEILEHYDERTDPYEDNRLVFMPLKGFELIDTHQIIGGDIMRDYAIENAFSNTKTWDTSWIALELTERFDPDRLWSHRLVCLDADRLVSKTDDGYEPVEGAYDLVCALKEKNKVVLETYRNLDFARQISEVLGSDDIIYSTGSGVFIQGRAVRSFPIPTEIAKAFTGFCDEVGIPWSASTAPGRKRVTRTSDFIDNLDKSSFETAIDATFDVSAQDVYELYAVCTDVAAEELPRFDACRYRRQSDGSYLLDVDMSCNALKHIAKVEHVKFRNIFVIGSYEDSSLPEGPWNTIGIGESSSGRRKWRSDGDGIADIEEACRFFGLI